MIIQSGIQIFSDRFGSDPTSSQTNFEKLLKCDLNNVKIQIHNFLKIVEDLYLGHLKT